VQAELTDRGVVLTSAQGVKSLGIPPESSIEVLHIPAAKARINYCRPAFLPDGIARLPSSRHQTEDGNAFAR
jgi:hypothetical protein